MLRPHDPGSPSRGSQQTNPHAREAYKKPGEHLTTLSLRAEARRLFLQVCRDPATRTRIHGPGKHDKTPCSTEKKAPGGVNPLLQGLGGYTRWVRSRAPTEASSTKHKSRQELPQAKSCQNLRESAHSLPEARGLLSGTIKRGTLSKDRKIA